MPSKVSPRRKACLLSISLFIFHYKITPSLSPYANKQHTHTQIQKCTKCTTRTLSLSLSLCKKTTERERVCVRNVQNALQDLSLSLQKSLSDPKRQFSSNINKWKRTAATRQHTMPEWRCTEWILLLDPASIILDEINFSTPCKQKAQPRPPQNRCEINQEPSKKPGGENVSMTPSPTTYHDDPILALDADDSPAVAAGGSKEGGTSKQKIAQLVFPTQIEGVQYRWEWKRGWRDRGRLK